MLYFGIKCGPDDNDGTFDLFKTGIIKILHCKFKLPRAAKWRGHPFYLELLRGYEKIISNNPSTKDEIYSHPVVV